MSGEQPNNALPKRKTGRSPAYPGFSVKRALELAEALHKQEGEYEAPLSSTVSAWGYSEKSSGGRQALATMKYYGLIDITGDGAARMVKISDLARRILLDQREDQTEKRRLIRQVALNPAAHDALYKKYGQGLASDGSVEHFLVFDEGFKSGAAKDLLAEFKDTADFAGLYNPIDSVDKNEEAGNATSTNESERKFHVGDRVQVTVNGNDLFADGTMILGFSEDGKWAFVDQSDSAASVEELTLMDAAPEKPPELERPAMPAHLLKPAEALGSGNEVAPAGMRKAMFPLDEGDVTLIFPEGISADSLGDLGDYLEIFLKKEQRKKQSSG